MRFQLHMVLDYFDVGMMFLVLHLPMNNELNAIQQ